MTDPASPTPEHLRGTDNGTGLRTMLTSLEDAGLVGVPLLDLPWRDDARDLRVPSPYNVERHWPIAGLNDDPRGWIEPCGGRRGCAAGGTCYGAGVCQAEHDRMMAAPYVWEGDQA